MKKGDGKQRAGIYYNIIEKAKTKYFEDDEGLLEENVFFLYAHPIYPTPPKHLEKPAPQLDFPHADHTR